MGPYNPSYDKREVCADFGDQCDECADKEFVISDTGKALIDGGADWVSDHVRMERDELAEGAAFSDLFAGAVAARGLRSPLHA